MPRGITSVATSAPTGGVGATDFTTQATKKAPRRKASYIGKKATIGRADVGVDAIAEDGKVLFISQRWLTPKGDPPSPDDAELTKYTAVVKAAKAWAALEGVAEEKLYIWIDYSSVDQDDLSELTKGVNSLGLFVCSADAFITIEHPDYFDRGWCLLECVFADASKVPRFVMTAGGDLKKETAEDRVALKKPHEGSFTVEADRGFMKQLEAAATFIKGQIERGFFEVGCHRLRRRVEGRGGSWCEVEGRLVRVYCVDVRTKQALKCLGSWPTSTYRLYGFVHFLLPFRFGSLPAAIFALFCRPSSFGP